MTGVVSWLQDTTGGLLLLAAAGIALLLVLIVRLKLEPFIALLIVGMLTALAAGGRADRLRPEPR